MMSFIAHPLWRVALAMYLAVWTPAMCCCAIKSALGEATCTIAIREGTPSCCAPKQETSCCAKSIESKTPSKPSCRCHEKSVDRLDTGSKTVVKAAEFQVGSLPWLHANDSISVPQVECSHIAIQLRRAHPPPLHSSLIALRTLLMI